MVKLLRPIINIETVICHIGTRLNKQHIAPHMYYRLRSGYVVTFGLSTRIFVLHAPEDVQIQDEVIL
jgi:hypothetical protein